MLPRHSDSTSAHPAVARVTRAVRETMPQVRIVYGVFPTCHRREILTQERQIDVIVLRRTRGTSLASQDFPASSVFVLEPPEGDGV